MLEFTDQTFHYPERRHSTTFEGIIETLEWVIIAMALAFIFRAFVMEAFRIPTGSMAETLRGAHLHLRCTRCGYSYDVGGDYLTEPRPCCPSCNYFLPTGTVKMIPISNGDRILVLKCIYQFVEPNRWDVVVFKNPVNPSENYIKRMIAKPGETVEIIDGDIYIDGHIARKPPNVQQELWMQIFDNDYQPSGEMVKLSESKTVRQSHDNRVWEQPFKNDEGSGWELDAENSSIFALDSKPEDYNIIYYDASADKDFKASYAYNNSNGYFRQPICSDLMVRFHVNTAKMEGLVGATLKKYETIYHAHINFTGELIIEKVVNGLSFELKRQKMESVRTNKAIPFKFANVDRQLILEFGNQKIIYDLGSTPDDAGDMNKGYLPEVRIFGAGKMALSHIGIYRDIHYISDGTLRAGQGKPFTLNDDEFFVCGDNSPYSQDGRLWPIEGVGNNSVKYRMGTVPRDYLVGKAVFVYWSDAFKPFGTMMPIIPNIDQVGFIQGGSDGEI